MLDESAKASLRGLLIFMLGIAGVVFAMGSAVILVVFLAKLVGV